MNSVALKMLTGDRAKYLGLVFSIAFCAFPLDSLTALHETEEAFVVYGRIEERESQLSGSEETHARALKLVKEQYQNGLASLDVVLDSERALLLVQDQSAQTEGRFAESPIHLFKGLRGTWTLVDIEGRSMLSAPEC